MTDPRYPIGPFRPPERIGDQDLFTAIDQISALPTELRSVVKGLSEEQFDTPYREGGWTIRQLVHHVADSHINSYVRFRLALTENEPSIKLYDEKAWADLVDSRHAEPGLSLDLLDCLHRRWSMLLHSFTPKEWARTFRHPERGVMRLDVNTLLYAWHGRHHTAHVKALRERQRW
jgi:hypothetical protein